MPADLRAGADLWARAAGIVHPGVCEVEATAAVLGSGGYPLYGSAALTAEGVLVKTLAASTHRTVWPVRGSFEVVALV